MTEKKEKKNSFLLYLEHEELINQLTNVQAGELIKGIFEYARTGVTPNLNPLENLVFISIRQDLDKNAEKYEEKRKKMSENGKRGGRPRKDINYTEQENQKNQKVFSESKKSLYDNDNVNVNVNDNDNDNDNVLSLSNVEKSLLRERGENFFSEKNNSSNAQENVPLEERDNNFSKKNLSSNNREEISQEEREILENFIKRKKLATKSVKAYASKLISNGDYKGIVDDERKRCEFKARGGIPPAQKIQLELESIVDKQSCARVLAPYYMRGDPPEEFSEVMEKYDLDMYDKVEVYLRSLSKDTA